MHEHGHSHRVEQMGREMDCLDFAPQSDRPALQPPVEVRVVNSWLNWAVLTVQVMPMSHGMKSMGGRSQRRERIAAHMHSHMFRSNSPA